MIQSDRIHANAHVQFKAGRQAGNVKKGGMHANRQRKMDNRLQPALWYLLSVAPSHDLWVEGNFAVGIACRI